MWAISHFATIFLKSYLYMGKDKCTEWGNPDPRVFVSIGAGYIIDDLIETVLSTCTIAHKM